MLKQNPLWFWPRDGLLGNESHVYGQVCWSNQSLVSFLIDRVKLYLKLQPDADVISITQNDNIRFCRTPEENAIVAEEGSDVGPMLRAVNAIADAIKDEHPHILVDTFAYINTLPAPRVTRPRDNVVIRICIASCNFAAPYSDPVNTLLFQAMQAWGKIAKHLAVWDYITNFQHNTVPMPDWYSFAPNLKYLHSIGLDGYMGEGSRRRDCHFDDTPCLSLLKHLIKVQGGAIK